MSDKTAQLARRREHLVAQAEAQRRALALQAQVWQKPLALADQGLAGLRYLRQHPLWLVGAGALVGLLRPARVAKLLTRGLLTWKMVQKLRGR